MTNLKDYSGPFKRDIKLTDFSKEALVRLYQAACKDYLGIDGIWLGCMMKTFGYERAFKYLPTNKDIAWFDEEVNKNSHGKPTILDPTAGGGSIPFEAMRLHLGTLANDLNPVAALIEKATFEFPVKYG